MAWSPIASASAGGAFGITFATTTGVDTTGADFIILSVNWKTTGTPVISDSKSNATWTPLTLRANANNESNRLYYCQAPTVGTGHTFTATESANTISIEMLAFSGSASSPFDVENGATTTNTSSLSSGNITPTVDNELIVTGYTQGGSFGSTPTVSSGYSTPVTVDFTGGTHEGGGIAYKIQTTATTTDATWDTAFGQDIAVTIASFKSAGAAPGIPPGLGPVVQMEQMFHLDASLMR